MASSPLDDTNQISIYIKPLGGYTKNLHSVLVNSNKSKEAGMLVCPFSFKLALEGPYGDESSFYLKYDVILDSPVSYDSGVYDYGAPNPVYLDWRVLTTSLSMALQVQVSRTGSRRDRDNSIPRHFTRYFASSQIEGARCSVQYSIDILC